MSEPDFSPKPPVLPLRPEEEVKRFWLPPGFKMELVLADPSQNRRETLLARAKELA